jgi:hypothetical protein
LAKAWEFPKGNFESSPERKPWVTLLLAAALFGLNCYIASNLFWSEFTRQYGSINGAFISYAAYAARNWGDLTWYPTWYGGTPFHNVYQPGLHLTVAALASLVRFTPQHAYHFITGLAYALGPVTLFGLCAGITRQRWYAFAVGLVYSLISPMALLSRLDGLDVGGPFHPRRFQILVHYGEGPHITAVMLLPLVILCLYRAGVERRAFYFPIACAVLASLVLTNWPGTVGLALAVVAFCISELGEHRVAWVRLGAIGAVAYLLACRWIPPSTVALVVEDAQQTDGNNRFHATHLLYLGGAAAFLLLAHISLRRAGAPPFLRFGIYFTLLTGLVTFSRAWFDVNLVPQPTRFQVELEMAIAITVCFLAKLLWNRMPRRVYIILGPVLLLAAIPLIKSDRRYARRLSAPMDMTQTSEYKMARQFARLRPQDRVFAPGDISFWMNLWTDTPQVSGCCDQGIPDFEHRVSDYVIYSGEGTGDRDAEISILWLRAYGATAVGVDGPKSTETYKPFRSQFKFEGLLPVLWRDGDDVIYDIPSRFRSLAHVIPRSAIIARAPVNGIDVGPLRGYVAAIEDPETPLAQFQWTSRHSAHISTFMDGGQVLSLQVSYDPGWHATVDGGRKAILRDKIGQMVVDTGCHGKCEVEMVYDGGREATLVAGAQLLGLFLAFAIPMKLTRST